MYFYVKDNQCFVGDNVLPKSTIGYKFYESDTKIEIYDNRNRANYFSDLITNLKKENDSAYADKADLAAAMPDFFFSIVKNYLEFEAFLSQSGANLPTANIMKNSIGITPVFTKNAVGDFRMTFTNFDFTTGILTKLDIPFSFDYNIMNVASIFPDGNEDFGELTLITKKVEYGVVVSGVDGILDELYVKLLFFPF